MKLVVLLAFVAATEALKIAAKPSLATAKLDAPSTLVAAGPAEVKALRGGFDMGMLQLLSYFFFWYLGNYYYNISNKLALKAAGGKTGYPMTIAALQMAVGVVYALYMWVAPDSRSLPSVTTDDLMKMLPVGFCAMGAHCFSVFAMSAGAVSFGQVVKAAEPVFAAAVGYAVYGKSISNAKILCLLPIIGGIALASAKELDFAWGALIAACTANIASAFRGAENKRTMEDKELKAAVGGGANTYAITTLWATLMLVPMIFISGEYAKFDEFAAMWKADGKAGTAGNLQFNTLMSGLTFYLYNEVSTLALKSISGVTHSVANTAKRAIIIVGCAIAFGESMAPIKMAGCSIAIAGTFFYAIADDIADMVGGKKKKKA